MIKLLRTFHFALLLLLAIGLIGSILAIFEVPAFAKSAAVTWHAGIVRERREKVMEFTSENSSYYNLAKDLACNKPLLGLLELNDPRSLSVFNAHQFTFVDHDIYWHCGKHLTCAQFRAVASDGRVRDIDVSEKGDIAIRFNGKVVLSEYGHAINQCEVTSIVKNIYDPDSLYLMGQEVLGNTQPFAITKKLFKPIKSLQEIYGGENYNGKSFAELEKFASQAKVTLAVIDQAFDLNEPELAFKTNRGAVGRSYSVGGIASVEHGTHVAGIATRDAEEVSLLLIDLGGDDLKSALTDFENTLAAIQYAAARGAKVVNISERFIVNSRQARDRACAVFSELSDTIFVIAAGNNDRGVNIDTESSFVPHSCGLPNVIVVGSVDSSGTKSAYSDFGPQTVFIGAEGEDIVSSIGGGKKSALSGTSMASPQVARVLAKMFVIKPDLSAIKAREILIRSARKSPELAKFFRSSGVLDEEEALRMTRLRAGNL
jgi:hypothetical protein